MPPPQVAIVPPLAAAIEATIDTLVTDDECQLGDLSGRTTVTAFAKVLKRAWRRSRLPTRDGTAAPC